MLTSIDHHLCCACGSLTAAININRPPLVPCILKEDQSLKEDRLLKGFLPATFSLPTSINLQGKDIFLFSFHMFHLGRFYVVIKVQFMHFLPPRFGFHQKEPWCIRLMAPWINVGSAILEENQSCKYLLFSPETFLSRSWLLDRGNWVFTFSNVIYFCATSFSAFL